MRDALRDRFSMGSNLWRSGTNPCDPFASLAEFTVDVRVQVRAISRRDDDPDGIMTPYRIAIHGGCFALPRCKKERKRRALASALPSLCRFTYVGADLTRNGNVACDDHESMIGAGTLIPVHDARGWVYTKGTGTKTPGLSPCCRHARDSALLPREILPARSPAAKRGDHQVSGLPATQEGPPLRTFVLQPWRGIAADSLHRAE